MENLKRICFCGHSTGKHLGDVFFQTYENHLLPNKHKIVACKRCGFVFADFESKQSIFDNYYEFYSKYEDMGLSLGKNSSTKNLLQKNIAYFIENNLKMSKNAHMIEIGSACGSQLKHLINLGYNNLYGLDPSEKCVNSCLELGITAYKGSMTNNEIGRSFDVIIADNVLEHVYNINEFFLALKKLLYDESFLILRVPDARSYTKKIYTKAYSAFTIEHINHFDIHSLINLGEIHNLRVVSTGFDPYDTGGLSIVYKKTGSLFYHKGINACEAFLDESKKMLIKKKKEIKIKVPKASKIVIWGIGSYYSRLSQVNFFEDYEVLALVDKDIHKQNKQIGNMLIISPEELQNIDNSFFIIVCAETCGESIMQDIKKLGFNGDIIPI